ncbi:MAG: hypothetical protein EXQ67_03840 [Thermoleophilia bacterium]|nr:hypothetical protein [Thermoleophilia bacterium]
MASSSESRTGVPRGRLLAVLIGGVIAAAAVVGLAALATQDSGKPAAVATVSRAFSDPLPGQPTIVVPPLAAAPEGVAKRVVWAEAHRQSQPGTESDLRLAAAQVAAGQLAAAQALLSASDAPSAQAALALTQYDDGEPATSLARLAAIAKAAPNEPFVQFSYGEALLWAGQRAAGEKVLRGVRDTNPETFYGIAADDLIHPAMPSGYPPFMLARAVPSSSLAVLKDLAVAAPNDAQAQVAYGAALIGAGRRSAASDAFDAALAVEPRLVEASVGKIIANYAKDNPAGSFGQIGPLVRDNPADPSPRLHLALMLLWLRDADTARAELRQVVSAAPNSHLARVAKQLLATIEP